MPRTDAPPAADRSPAAALAARVAALRAGDRATLARAITEIENELPSAPALHAALREHAGHAHVVGITGPPGAGKSTLINALVTELARRGKRVAVAAVDPSSPVTGGAVLGDRVRMDIGIADNVFIRSLASRGHGGGLARTTPRVVDVLDAAGFDTIVVETVGAGQSDVDIAAFADTSIVVSPPGLGDGIQAIKAGILEIADILVVTKADTPNATRTERDLLDMLRLRARKEGWRVPVLCTSATTGDGIAKLADTLDEHARAAGIGRRVQRTKDPAVTPLPADRNEALRILASRDAFVRHCGIEFVSGGAGRAAVRMRVGHEHLNFNGTCHGGAIFTLADTAFGLASNSHGVIAAGIDAHATFHTAVRAGDVLVAQATEASRGRRTAIYRVDVLRDADLVATFTGTVYVTTRGHA
ncbi:MAG: methylmalonyl Co-A mutase-associated GTPase MeaB [Burkholderiales bacterium]|nr:methylmalonyl Co-A mutase-associated GTPase MeaB [Burkholderiales bacterium]